MVSSFASATTTPSAACTSVGNSRQSRVISGALRRLCHRAQPATAAPGELKTEAAPARVSELPSTLTSGDQSAPVEAAQPQTSPPVPQEVPPGESAWAHLQDSAAENSAAENSEIQDQTDAKPRSAAERRAYPRWESHCQVELIRSHGHKRLSEERVAWLLESPELAGQVIDVSMAGIAFVVSESLPPGTGVYLRLLNRAFGFQLDVEARVLRCTPGHDGWTIVCQLLKQLTFEQVHQVGRQIFSSTIV